MKHSFQHPAFTVKYPITVLLIGSLLIFGINTNKAQILFSPLDITPGTITDLDAVNANTVYAGTQSGGVFKTTDGSNWSPTSNGLSSLGIFELDAVDELTVYLLDGSGKIFKTVDGADNWFDVSLADPTQRATTISTVNANNVYVGTSSGRVFKTIDGGANWTEVSPILTAADIQTIFALDENTVYFGNSDGIFKTTNGGTGWTAATTIFPGGTLFIEIIAIDANTAFTATSNGVYKTTNGGADWSSVNNGLPIFFTEFLEAIDADTLYAGLIGEGIYKTIDGGANWLEVNNGLPSTTIDPDGLTIGTSNTLFAAVAIAGSTTGVYKTTDFANNWTEVSNGLTNLEVISVDVAEPDTIFVGTSKGAFRSTDGGENWTDISDGAFSGTIRKITAINGKSLFGTTVTFDLYKSVDGGDNWTILPDNGPVENFFAVDENILFLTTFSSVFLSTNGGTTFTQIDNGLPDNGFGENPFSQIYAVDENTIYLGGQNVGIYKTTNGGTSWVAINTGLGNVSNLVFSSMFGVGSDIVYAGTRNNGIFKTINGGTNWTPINNGISDSNIQSIYALNKDTAYIGTESSGVFETTDCGANWTPINEGLTNPLVLSLYAINTDTIYAATRGNSLFAGIQAMPEIEVDDAIVGTDFGSIVLSQTDSKTYTITNTGTADLTVSTITSDDGQFVINGFTDNSIIAPNGGTLTFDVDFTPTSLGTQSATITISSDDQDEAMYTFDVSGTGVSPEIEVDDAVVGTDFGSLVLSQTDSKTYTITNTGTANLTVSTIASNEGQFVINEFTDNSVIAPNGGTLTFEVAFMPTSLGAQSATISINSDDQDEAMYTFDVSGTGVSPEIEVDDAVVGTDFGSLVLSQTDSKTYTITNTGTADLTVATITSDDGQFVVNGFTDNSLIAPNGGTLTFDVDFTPTSLGAQSATITISSDDQDEAMYTFDVSGTGVSPEIEVDDAVVGTDFGSLVLSQTDSKIYTITNTGTADLTVATITSDDGQFVINGFTNNSIIAPNGGTLTFELAFTPTNLGAQSATISINSDDQDEPTYSFVVSGVGEEVPELPLGTPLQIFVLGILLLGISSKYIRVTF